ncbi:MAG: AIR carboxylase family protein, partial [Bacteroidota bacterium]|nr:AIR carboxylase family protein [Bacteroidota bacterium]
VATVAVNGARNASILAVQMLALGDESLMKRFIQFKEDLKGKIVKANSELAEIKFKFKTN